MTKMEEGLSVFTLKRPIEVEAFRNFGKKAQAYFVKVKSLVGETTTDQIDGGTHEGIQVFIGLPSEGSTPVDLSELTPSGMDYLRNRPDKYVDMLIRERLSGKWITVASNNIDAIA